MKAASHSKSKFPMRDSSKSRKNEEEDLEVTLAKSLKVLASHGNKNSRTLSLDLTHSIGVRKTYESLASQAAKSQNVTTHAADEERSVTGHNNPYSMFKDFANRNKKKLRTSYLANYNMTECNDDVSNNIYTIFTNPLVPSTTKENSGVISNNTIFNAKKKLTKTQSGDATTFSKYLSNINNLATTNISHLSSNKNKNDSVNFNNGTKTMNMSINYNKPVPNINIYATNSVNNKNTTNTNQFTSAFNGNLQTQSNFGNNQGSAVHTQSNFQMKNENSKKAFHTGNSRNATVTPAVSSSNVASCTKKNKTKVSYPYPKYSNCTSSTKNSKGNSLAGTGGANLINNLNVNLSNNFLSASTNNIKEVLTKESQPNSNNCTSNSFLTGINITSITKPSLNKETSLNISQDCCRSRTSKTPIEDEIELDETEAPLTNETKGKLNEIKQSIIELMNTSRQKNNILKELENIYRYVLKVNSPIGSTCDEEHLNSIPRKSLVSSTNSFTTSVMNFNISQVKSSKRNLSEKEVILVDLENDLLKKENENLKGKMEIFDKKFDQICTENKELKEYVKEKTENVEDLRSVLKNFQLELNEMKRHSQMTTSYNPSSNNILIKDSLNNSVKNMKDLSKIKINMNSLNLPNYNSGLDSLNNKIDCSLDDKNFSIDQIANLKSPSKNLQMPRIFPQNTNFNLIPKLRFDNKEEDSLEMLSDNEKTGCFADFINKKENNRHQEDSVYVEQYNKEECSDRLYEEEFSVDLDSLNRMNNLLSKSTNKVSGLNFANLNRQDFNDEFMQNYNDFSPSWRKEAERVNLMKYTPLYSPGLNENLSMVHRQA